MGAWRFDLQRYGWGGRILMTTQKDMYGCAKLYAERYGWYVFPIHNPIHNDAGQCTGCTCEHYRRSDECKRNHPKLYIGPAGKCANPGKCPRVRWAEKSTIDLAQIRQWWTKTWRDIDVETGAILYNYPNIGVDCDKSDLLVFDADTYKQVGDLSELLPFQDRETVTVITQGGGEHLIYRRHGKPYGNSSRGLPPGIDIRGAGGYIVAVPSLGKSGRRYQYEEDYAPKNTALLPIPKALDDILNAATPKHRCRGDDVVLNHPTSIRRSVDMVEKVLERADLDTTGAMEYGQGRRWVFEQCPFMPDDDQHADDGGAFVIVLDDGRISAGCHHNRCQKAVEASGLSGWQYLRRLAGMERRECKVTVVVL
jgi:Bifunctional DNA primase/polymerase, N-terminal